MAEQFAFQFRATGTVTPGPTRMNTQELADYISEYANTLDIDMKRYLLEAASRLSNPCGCSSTDCGVAISGE